MQEPGVFYHVPGPLYSPGMPLLSWNRLKAAGVVTAEDWRHRGVQESWDGDVISLHTTLPVAREYRTDERDIPDDRPILRIRIPLPHGNKVRETPGGEQVLCYPDEIPAEWIEIVDEDEPDEPDPMTHLPWLKTP